MKTVLFRWFKALNHGVIIGIELMAVVALIVAGLFSYVLYELARGPLDLNFARGYIQDSLSGGAADLQVQVKGVQATWPELSGPLTLDLKGLQVWQGDQMLAEVDDLSVAVAKAPLLLGQIRPVRLIVRGPTIMLERTMDGDLHFALDGIERTIEAQQASTAAGANAVAKPLMAMLFGTDKSGFGAFAHISELEIRQARIRIADEPIGMTWQLNDVTLFFQETNVGVYGAVSLRLAGAQHFSLVMTYQRARDELNINSHFTDFYMPSIVGRLAGIDGLRRQRLPLTGTVEIDAHLKPLSLSKLSIKATAPQGQLDTMGALSDVLPVDDVNVDMSYSRAEDKWTIPDFSFHVRTIPVRVSGVLQANSDRLYKGNLQLVLDELRLDQIGAFWPDEARGLPLETWLLHRLSGGVLHNVKIDVPLRTIREDRRLTMLALKPTATFDFTDLQVNYRDPLHPVEEAKGSGSFANDTLNFQVAEGKIADLTLSPSTVAIHDVTKKGQGHADINVYFTGPLKTVLEYIALEPIRLGGKLPIKPDVVKGTGTYHAHVTFPTIKDMPADLVEVDVDAKLNDLSLPGLVKGQTLSGGPYDLVVKDGDINMKGSGMLDGRKITLDWSQPVHGEGKDILMSVKAKVESDDLMRQKFGAALDFLQGPVPADVVYTERASGQDTVEIKADLTPARVLFDALRYEKAPGLAAEAALTLHLNKGVPTKATDLNVTAPRLTLAGGTLTFAGTGKTVNLSQAQIKSFKLGSSDLSVKYRREADRMVIDAIGPKLDLAPFLSGSSAEPETGPRLLFSVQADDVSFGGVESMKQVDFSVALNERADLDRLQLSALAGGAPVLMRYVPDPTGKMTLALEAQNAGAYLRAMGIYDNMMGGVLNVDGSPIGNNNRDVKGNLLIRDFNIVKAPVLAQLLGGLSVQGVGDQLGNKGIGFSRLESGFAWLRRPKLDLMTFRSGRTSGSALGLTFDGQYDRRKREVEITGTIIPVSGLNTFASNIPLLGEIISGGKGSALFAATYSIKGPSDSPRTVINPLSVLTPGILRRIFFEQIPSDPLAPAPARTQPRNNQE